MKLQENINRIKEVMGVVNEDEPKKEESKRKTQEMEEGELTERCWKGYTQKGMKTMFGKRYPNCVKIKK
jgi:hypothetical protein